MTETIENNETSVVEKTMKVIKQEFFNKIEKQTYRWIQKGICPNQSKVKPLFDDYLVLDDQLSSIRQRMDEIRFKLTKNLDAGEKLTKKTREFLELELETATNLYYGKGSFAELMTTMDELKVQIVDAVFCKCE